MTSSTAFRGSDSNLCRRLNDLATPAAPDGGIYDPDRVRLLFDRMSTSYDRMNLVLSLGFSSLWRRQLLALPPVDRQPRTVLDLMSGRGETWARIARRFPAAHITAIDFSEQMIAQSAHRNGDTFDGRVEVLCEDALRSSVADGSVDVIVSCFGLKTFNPAQSDRLADEVVRMLRPGGSFAFIEVTEPSNRMLRWVYSRYLRWVVPLVGTALLADPTEYRMLHRYLAAYGDGATSVASFRRHESLHLVVRRHFFGCATSISGYRVHE